jgi:hypothetical protein
MPAIAPTSQPQITPRPEVLSGAFEPGFVGEAEEKRYPVRVVRIGEMEIASGRVLLVDPFLMSTDDKALALSVRPGRYPVDLAVADAGESGQRVALARLLLSPAPAVRWVMAVTDEQDATTLKGDEVFGYGVDAGVGAFVDAAGPAWLATEYPPSDHDRYATLQDDWQARGEAAGEALGIPYGFALIERLGRGDAAMFSSGWGDGHYASWVGYDSDDLPVVIVTDFAVITAVNFPSTSDSR